MKTYVLFTRAVLHVYLSLPDHGNSGYLLLIISPSLTNYFIFHPNNQTQGCKRKGNVAMARFYNLPHSTAKFALIYSQIYSNLQPNLPQSTDKFAWYIAKFVQIMAKFFQIMAKCAKFYGYIKLQ